MKKLPCLTKSKNRDGYYFTPTVDGKTKWIPLGNDKQVALEKDHILMQGESRARSVNEGLDLYLNGGGDIDLFKTQTPPVPTERNGELRVTTAGFEWRHLPT